MQATPQAPTISPVAAADFADYLSVESYDPLLPGMLIAATDAVIEHINHDLTPRTWIAKAYVQGYGPRQLSRRDERIVWYELPYTGLLSVASVMVNNEPVDYETVFIRPGKIRLEKPHFTGTLEVTYSAGFASIPTTILEAIKMVGAYLYEHRGMCDAGDAVRQSGAAVVLSRFRVEVSL